jgi:hypothetical protein
MLSQPIEFTPISHSLHFSAQTFARASRHKNPIAAYLSQVASSNVPLCTVFCFFKEQQKRKGLDNQMAL